MIVIIDDKNYTDYDYYNDYDDVISLLHITITMPIKISLGKIPQILNAIRTGKSWKIIRIVNVFNWAAIFLILLKLHVIKCNPSSLSS